MVDFQAERSRGTGLNFDVQHHAKTPVEYEAEFGTLHWLWRRLTTGAGLVAAAVGISTIVSIVLASAFISGLLYRDHAEEGRAVLQRLFDLTALQTGSQSALGCLDVSPEDPLEASCERAIFATAQSAASARAFVAARLSVLGDALAYSSAVRSPPSGAVVSLRQAVENDPFGIVAHVLAARYGCSASQCSAFAMLADTSKVAANLNARTFETLVARYEVGWQEVPAASALASQGAALGAVSSLLGQGAPVVAPVLGSTSTLHPVPGGKPPRGLNVPPASSIPAVSIMTDEPRAPPAQTGKPSSASGSTQRAPASSRSTPPAPPPAPPGPPTQLTHDPANPS